MLAPRLQELAMANALRILSAGLLCLGSGACQPAGTPPATADTTSAPTVAEPHAPAQPAATQPAPTTPAATNSSIGYLCDGGATLSASYGDHDVTLRWPDGRSVTLPRAESASKGGGDVYVGETASLQRDGDHIQLHDGDAPAMACTASGDSA
jgi:hypothetical protein